MPTEIYYIQNNDTYLTAKYEICAIIDQILTIIDSHESNKKALNDQKKMNDANKATIAQMVVEKHAMDKKVSNAADWLEEVNDKNEKLTKSSKMGV